MSQRNQVNDAILTSLNVGIDIIGLHFNETPTWLPLRAVSNQAAVMLETRTAVRDDDLTVTIICFCLKLR